MIYMCQLQLSIYKPLTKMKIILSVLIFRAAFKGETKISGNLLGTGTSGSFGAITGYLAFNTTQIEALTSESKPCILYRKYAVIDDSIDYSVSNF